MRLFHESGFAETSMRRIADEAGVSERTVYLVFGDKASLLHAIADEVSFGGDPDAARRFADELADLPEPAARLRAVVHQFASAWEGGLASLGRVVTAATIGTPEFDGLVAEMNDRRHRETRACLESIIGSRLEDGEETERLVDEVEALMSEESYWILTVERGWDRADYEDFVFQAVAAAMDRRGLGPGSREADHAD